MYTDTQKTYVWCFFEKGLDNSPAALTDSNNMSYNINIFSKIATPQILKKTHTHFILIQHVTVANYKLQNKYSDLFKCVKVCSTILLCYLQVDK